MKTYILYIMRNTDIDIDSKETILSESEHKEDLYEDAKLAVKNGYIAAIRAITIGGYKLK